MKRILAFLVRIFYVLAIGIVVYLLVSQSQTIRNLSEQNRHLNQQSLSYQRCLAQVFTKYTVDQRPITKADLDTCTIKQSDGTVVPVTPASDTPNVTKTTTSSSSTSVTTPSASQMSSPASTSSESSSSPQSAPNTQPTQPDNSQPPPLLDCKVDLLGLHLGCP